MLQRGRGAFGSQLGSLHRGKGSLTAVLALTSPFPSTRNSPLLLPSIGTENQPRSVNHEVIGMGRRKRTRAKVPHHPEPDGGRRAGPSASHYSGGDGYDHAVSSVEWQGVDYQDGESWDARSQNSNSKSRDLGFSPYSQPPPRYVPSSTSQSRVAYTSSYVQPSPYYPHPQDFYRPDRSRHHSSDPPEPPSRPTHASRGHLRHEGLRNDTLYPPTSLYWNADTVPGPVNARAPRRNYYTDRKQSTTFQPQSPTPSYLSLSLEASSAVVTAEHPSAKLLILDLNGTLVWRSDRQKGPNRRIHPRPYMDAFTSYALHPGSRLYTMIWSSAQPANVDKMALQCFGLEKKEKLKAIWARDTLGLSPSEYGRKVQTVKDLRLIWDGITFTPPGANQGERRFSARDTLLLDDSELKAHRQPYNHIILPEYDKDTYRNDYTIFRSSPVSPSDNHDQTLLAIIGILDEAVKHENVASWIRSGGMWAGLKPIPGPYQGGNTDLLSAGTGERMPALSDQAVRSESRGSSPLGLLQEYAQMHPRAPETIESSSLLTMDEEELWFHDSTVTAEWIGRGRLALQALGIPDDPGFSVDPDASSPPP